MRLAALAWPVGPTPDVRAYAEKLDRLLSERPEGTELALTAEYACVELGASLAPGGDEAAELRAMVARAPEILAAMRDAARRHRIWLQPGTLPMAAGDRVVNRAPLIRPDGALALQDKSIMTRFETERWGVSPGAPPRVFDTDWGRVGIAICYDAEFPKIARAQAEAGAWVLLVPSCTDTWQGAERVRIGARARAMENQLYAAVAPTVGDLSGSAALDENRGWAGVYGPVDQGFPQGGVIAEAASGWVAAALDRAALERVREDGAVRNFRDFPRAPLPACGPAEWAA